MRLSLLSRLEKSLALRLTLWYAVTFLLVTVAISIISYVYLSSAVRDNAKMIQNKLEGFASIAQQYGVSSIPDYDTDKHPPYSRRGIITRLIDHHGVVTYESNPQIWKEFPAVSRSTVSVGVWQYVPSSRDRDVLEVMTGHLPGGYLLQVGKEIEDRKEILGHYRDTIFGVTISMIIIGLAGGALLAFRAMRPVRQLSQVIESIVRTGDVKARVPESGRGDELDELSRLFNQMLGRIQLLIVGMREALDNVAHDLRTPLTRLRGAAEVALHSHGDIEQCREALASNIEESDRMLSLLTSLMDISEAETGTMRLKPERLNLVKILNEVAELYQYVAEEKNISIRIDGAPEIEITADRSRLRQVFANLMDNAIKYNLTGGHVYVEIRQEPNQTIVTFEDSGISIAPEDVGRIWDRLYRGDTSRSQPGLGLGLSLVKAVVRAHQGTVEVRSANGKGSVFKLSLPLNPVASA